MVKVYNGDKVRIRTSRAGSLWHGGEVETVTGEGNIKNSVAITSVNSILGAKSNGHPGVWFDRLETMYGEVVTGYGGDWKPKFSVGDEAVFTMKNGENPWGVMFPDGTLVKIVESYGADGFTVRAAGYDYSQAIPLANLAAVRRHRVPAADSVSGRVLTLYAKLPEGITALDAMRGLGMAGGTFTKAISLLRHQHGYRVSKAAKKDKITGSRYSVYRLTPPA